MKKRDMKDKREDRGKRRGEGNSTRRKERGEREKEEIKGELQHIQPCCQRASRTFIWYKDKNVYKNVKHLY